MKKAEEIANNLRIWAIFNQAAEATMKVVDNELFRKYGISRIQAHVLYIVKNSSNLLSPSEISRRLLREPHSAGSLINRMEKQGLIKKTRDPVMKNISRISLTENGEETYSRMVREMETPHKLLSYLSSEEKAVLLKCSEKLRDEALELLVIKRLWSPLFDED